MENHIGKRIESLVTALGLNRNSFAKSLNKSFTTIQIITEGKSKPGYDVLELILTIYPQVNPGWLMKGTGEMFLNSENKVDPEIGNEENKVIGNEYLFRHLEKLEESFFVLNQQMDVKDKQIEVKDRQIEAKDKQIEKLMDLLGKPLDVVEETRTMPLWKKVEEKATA